MFGKRTYCRNNIYFIVLSFFFILSCTEDKNCAELSVQSDNKQWFYLNKGEFIEFNNFNELSKFNHDTHFLPWTIQTRVSGFIQVDNYLYIAINGCGISYINVPFLNDPVFYAINNPSVFSGRTIGSLFFINSSIFCHLYKNTHFYTPDISTSPVALISLVPETKRIYVSPLFFQAENPEWEAVKILYENESWYIEWKKTEEKKVEFRYSVYSFGEFDDVRIDSDTFRRVYDFHDIKEAPTGLQHICKKVFDTVNNSIVIHIEIKAPAYEKEIRYRAGSAEKLSRGEADLLTLPVFNLDTFYFTLMPDARILIADDNGEITECILPRLPESFEYTDLWTDGKRYIISWEQKKFPDVGAAGILYMKIDFNK